MNNHSDTYQLTVNQKFRHTLSVKDVEQLDIVSLGNGLYHLIMDDQSYRVELLHIDSAGKKISMKIGGEKYTVTIADAFDQLVEKMGLNLKVKHRINEVKAPMPGLVLSIEVTEGQEVIEGDPLLVLEAMKMENIIKSPGAGIVKAIPVQLGRPVEKGEVLIQLE